MFDFFKTYIHQWLHSGRLSDNDAEILEILIFLGAVSLVAWISFFIARKILTPLAHKITKRTSVKWDDYLFKSKIINKAVNVIPAAVALKLIPIFLSKIHGSEWYSFFLKTTNIYLLVTFLLFLDAVSETALGLSASQDKLKNKPLHGFYQLTKIILIMIGALVTVAIIFDKSALTILTGLGASAAVLLLIFKDTILGFVAGIQLSGNDMLRVGDWITVPQFNADGVVEQVTLNTVKIRNFDNTIITVPPYSLISGSFQNWHAMEEEGLGRRIKRAVNIDVTSIHFCDELWLNNLKKNEKLHTFLNSLTASDFEETTNLTLFRKYVYFYVKNHPKTNKKTTYMVRELSPLPNGGIPVEIYFFSIIVDWIPYENLMADVIDHVISAILYFDLKSYRDL